MELFLELILTICLSLFFTSLFIKLASMQPIDTTADSDEDRLLTEESIKIDKFQGMPFKDDMIKLEECPNEGKSYVEFHNFVGVEKEEDSSSSKFHDVVVVETLVESKDGKTEEDNNTIEEDDDDDGDYKVQEERVENGGERKLSEIEIESVEEEEENENENEIMNDWEEIGIKDFEELVGKKTGLYYNVGVVDYQK